MTGRTRCLRRGALVLALLVALPAQADWRRDYDLGRRAAEARDWAEVSARMQAAIRDDAQPEVRKRFQGMRFDTYVPHFYAGLAAYHQGDCAAALEFWRHPGSARVLAELPELDGERARLSRECVSRLAAESTPDAGTPEPPRVAEAPPPREPPTPAQPPPRAEPPPASTTASRPPAPSRPAPRQAEPAPRAAEPAPPLLRRALEHWLAGRYRELVALDPGAITEARARAQALQLRAAARFVQAELEGRDPAADAAIAADLEAARRAARVGLDEALFPPRFRRFASR